MPDHSKLRLADLSARSETAFDLTPDAEDRAALAQALDLSALRKLSFAGVLKPVGKRDWELQARLGATVVQPCVVTLDPVTTRIDDDVTRRYSADWQAPEGDEVEMTEDDETDPLPEVLNLAQVMEEALALAIPPFPRAEGAASEAVQVTEPGKAALTDEDVKPFAGLAALRDKLRGDEDA